MEGNTKVWMWDVGFEQNRHRKFGKSTDEICETTAGLYKTGLPKERRCKGKLAEYYISAFCCIDVSLVHSFPSLMQHQPFTVSPLF
jgi:hypothetical protein